MRKLAHLFTDLLLGPAPSSLGTATTPPASGQARDAATGVAEVIVVDEADQHLHDFLEMFPAEAAPAPTAPARRRRRVRA